MKQKYHLDSVDRRILRALQEDATITHAALAERVGASTASCWRRLKVLSDAGVVRETVRLVDPVMVGKGVNVLCQVRMKAHERPQREAFERFAIDSPEILECYSMSGEWDYLLRVVVSDVTGYERFLMHRLLAQPAVAATSSQFALSQVKYSTIIPLDE